MLPIHAGPGEGYRLVGKLAKGERVPLLRCTRQSRWCYVLSPNGEGWVLGSYLVGSGAKAAVTPFEFKFTPFRRRNRDDDLD